MVNWDHSYDTNHHQVFPLDLPFPSLFGPFLIPHPPSRHPERSRRTLPSISVPIFSHTLSLFSPLPSL